MPHGHCHHFIFTILFFTFIYTCGGERQRDNVKWKQIHWLGYKTNYHIFFLHALYDYLVSEEICNRKRQGYGVMESKTRRQPLSLSLLSLSLSLSLSLYRSPSKPFSTQTHQPTLLFLSLFPIF